MKQKIGDLSPFLIKVLDSNDQVNGTGFLCHQDGYALTCWHVVADWLTVNGQAKQEPITGPITGKVSCGGTVYDASLLPNYSAKGADIAVLKLERLQTGSVKPWPYLPLDTHWRVALQDGLHSFGYPTGGYGKVGIAISGKMGGLTSTKGKVDEIGDVELYPIIGLNIRNVDYGFSGAPLVNEATQKVIGLISFKEEQGQDKSAVQAFITPLAPLFESWPEIKAEHDVFEKIRRQLGEEALDKLQVYLHASPFIPLNLECGVIPERRLGQENEGRQLDPMQHAHGRHWEVLDRKRLLPPSGHFLLSSDVGTGKTTFVYWLATELVRNTRTVPLVFSCVDFEKIAPNSWEDLKQVLINRLKDEFLDTDLHAFFEHTNKQLVFLFDGLDQITNPNTSPSNLVNEVIKIVSTRSLLITSRPSAVLAIEHDRKLKFLRLKPFSSRDQQLYFGNRYPEAKKLTALAPELTQVPMLAHMVRELIEEDQLKKVSTRTAIYQDFIDYTLSKHEPNRPLDLEDWNFADSIKAALKQIAFLALASDPPQIQKIAQKTYPSVAGVRLTELTRSGLINRVLDHNDKFLFFTHQSYQEFLAAQYVNEHPVEIDRVLTERWNPKWREVIKFLAGLRGEELIQKILAEKDNVIHANLFLTASCAREINQPGAGVINAIRAGLFRLANVGPFRVDALKALGQLGAWADAETLRAIVARLGDEDEELDVRRAAVEALAQLSEQVDAETLHAIVARLGDEIPVVRLFALRALGQLGEQVDAETLRAIVARLGDEEHPHVREAALKALGQLGERVDAEMMRAIVARLGDENSEVRGAAVEALGQLGAWVDAETLHAIVARLGDESPTVRRVAVKVLGQLGEQVDAETLRAIVTRLGDEELDVCMAAVKVLGQLGDQVDAETLRAIDARLRDEEQLHVREAALEALGQLGDGVDAETLRAIVARLGDEEQRHVREAAVKALGQLGWRVDAEPLRAIVARLGDEEQRHVREAVLKALGQLGWRVEAETLRAIAAWKEDRELNVRMAAVEALRQLGDQVDAETLRGIVARLGDKNYVVRMAAVGLLAQLGEHVDAETIRAIAARLGDEEYVVRLCALKVLGQLGDQVDAETLRTIVARLGDEVVHVCAAAASTLGQLGGRMDAETIRAIAPWLEDESDFVRMCALSVLGQLGNRVDAEMMRSIVARLGDEENVVRMEAVEALRQLGDQVDAETLRGIVARLGDEEYVVRSVAQKQLKQLYESGQPLPTEIEISQPARS